MVACRQLGLEFVRITSSSYYHSEQGKDLYLVYNLNCTGSEGQLTDCDDDIFDKNSCSYRKAGLVCDGKLFCECTVGDWFCILYIESVFILEI